MSIPAHKRKELRAKLFFGIMIILLLVIASLISTCSKDMDKAAEVIQQTKDDGKMVEIDGKQWKKITFFDEDDRCWKIYTYEDGMHAKSVFAVVCPKKGKES